MLVGLEPALRGASRSFGAAQSCKRLTPSLRCSAPARVSYSLNSSCNKACPSLTIAHSSSFGIVFRAAPSFGRQGGTAGLSIHKPHEGQSKGDVRLVTRLASTASCSGSLTETEQTPVPLETWSLDIDSGCMASSSLWQHDTHEVNKEWIYHSQAVEGSVSDEEEDNMDNNKALVVQGSAEEISYIKRQMQDRHVKASNIAELAAQTLQREANSEMCETAELASCLHDLPCSMTAVFDGHGGARAATYSAKNIVATLVRNRRLWSAIANAWRPVLDRATVHEVSGALCTAFADLDAVILENSMYKPPSEFDGTTALVGLQVGQHLFIANAGDSRAVLSRGGQAVRLTQDHTPDEPTEKARIEAIGGLILSLKGTWRLCLNTSGGYVYKVSSVTRALGDIDYKQPKELISGIPDVFHWTLHPRYDRFAIFATDGVWGFVTDQQAVDCVERTLAEARCLGFPAERTAELAAKRLVALAKEMKSYDDITAVVTLFNWQNTAR